MQAAGKPFLYLKSKGQTLESGIGPEETAWNLNQLVPTLQLSWSPYSSVPSNRQLIVIIWAEIKSEFLKQKIREVTVLIIGKGYLCIM